ncbi:MAG: hypothetical protein ACK4SA_00270 [Caldilinea sp.]
MALAVEDLIDLRRLLIEHPEWQAELRQLLLTGEVLTLPDVVRELADAQRRTEARVEELAESMRGLAEAQLRTEARLEELAEAQRRTEESLQALEQQVKELRQAIDELSEIVNKLIESQSEIKIQMNDFRGFRLEMRYAQHASGYFGHWLRRARSVLPGNIDPDLEDMLEAHLTSDELIDLLHADILVSGLLRKSVDGMRPEIWLLVEVSAVIDRKDIERAMRRAALMKKAGFRCVPVVAGDSVTRGATELLRDAPVALMLNGRSTGWEFALAAA